MSIFSAADFRDFPADTILSRVPGTFALWRKRMRERSELATIAVRDLRDAGIDPGLAAFEASKPFWRA